MSASNAFWAPAAARTVVGDVKRKRPTENAALGVDLFDRKFRRLHDGRGNDRVCPREADRHPDPDGISRHSRSYRRGERKRGKKETRSHGLSSVWLLMHECPSVPTALDVAAQHLIIVEIGVAVSQNLIENVQLRGSPRFARRNVRNKYLPHSADKSVSVFAADFAILVAVPIVETCLAHAALHCPTAQSILPPGPNGN